jgi:hypothetical protein
MIRARTARVALGAAPAHPCTQLQRIIGMLAQELNKSCDRLWLRDHRKETVPVTDRATASAWPAKHWEQLLVVQLRTMLLAGTSAYGTAGAT